MPGTVPWKASWSAAGAQWPPISGFWPATWAEPRKPTCISPGRPSWTRPRARPWPPGHRSGRTAAARRRTAWLRFAGRTVRLRDSKGLRDLAVLLGRPDEQTHVSELTSAAGFPGADAGPVADRRALAAYRQQLRRIGAELASADAGTAEAEALSREREALLAELSATTGPGGRLRVAGSPTQRMRNAVTYRIRHAIARIA